MSAPSPNVVTALRALAAADKPLLAVEVGGHIVAAARARGETRLVGQRGPRYIGPAAIAAPTLRSMSLRGWAGPGFIEHPLTGDLRGAWVITEEGRAALAEIDAPPAP